VQQAGNGGNEKFTTAIKTTPTAPITAGEKIEITATDVETSGPRQIDEQKHDLPSAQGPHHHLRIGACPPRRRPRARRRLSDRQQPRRQAWPGTRGQPVRRRRTPRRTASEGQRSRDRRSYNVRGAIFGFGVSRVTSPTGNLAGPATASGASSAEGRNGAA
jgi:hypothetical protein